MDIGILKGTVTAVLQIFIIGLIGFWVLFKKVLGECCLRTLTDFVIYVTLPCLIISNITQHFNPAEQSNWWLFPLLGVATLLFGLLVAFVWTKVDRGMHDKGEFMCLSAFQNAGFLPIPIIAGLFQGERAEMMLTYLFLFNLFFGVVVYSLSPLLLKGAAGGRLKVRDVISNPFLATTGSVILVLTGLAKFIPTFVIKPVGMLGNATVPLVMVVIGGVIYINWKTKVPTRAVSVFKATLLKLLVFPAIVTAVILALHPSWPVAFLLVMEAAMPAASSLTLLAKKYDANFHLIGRTTLWSYVVSIATIPFFLSVFQMLYH